MFNAVVEHHVEAQYFLCPSQLFPLVVNYCISCTHTHACMFMLDAQSQSQTQIQRGEPWLCCTEYIFFLSSTETFRMPSEDAAVVTAAEKFLRFVHEALSMFGPLPGFPLHLRSMLQVLPTAKPSVPRKCSALGLPSLCFALTLLPAVSSSCSA